MQPCMYNKLRKEKINSNINFQYKRNYKGENKHVA